MPGAARLRRTLQADLEKTINDQLKWREGCEELMNPRVVSGDVSKKALKGQRIDGVKVMNNVMTVWNNDLNCPIYRVNMGSARLPPISCDERL